MQCDIALAQSTNRWFSIPAYQLRLSIGCGVVIFDMVVICIASAFFLFRFPIGQALIPNIEAQFLFAVFYLVFAITARAFHFDKLLHFRKSASSVVLPIFYALLTIFAIKFVLHREIVNVFSMVFATGALLTIAALSLRMAVRSLIGKNSQSNLFDNVLVVDSVQVQVPAGFRTIDAHARGLEPDPDNPLMRHWAADSLQHADRVVIACNAERCERWAQFLSGSQSEIRFYVPNASGLGIFSTGTIQHDIFLKPKIALNPDQRCLKRIFDICGAIILLFLFIPLMLLTGLLVKLDHPGPMIFEQVRIGRGNRLFPLYKFRSLKTKSTDFSGQKSVTQSDDRMTSIGKFIRATSIDELPQLLNVLRGEMSLVGPRPHALASQAENQLFWEIDQDYWRRHAIKPGMTGLAQIRGFRGATDERVDLVNRLKSDMDYLRDWSIWRDIYILAATPFVLIHKNAY
ncbi:sugar transferase [Parasphingorhabdus halotolerans]|uniref:Sugar transferase n=2 Tax=Parasphingorhabdus halotolerans TaxID=2725558 RepID=A0A6H2DQY2_9SPHN|nr:sugar transferase [Parasphingorhabdus halotolerans]